MIHVPNRIIDPKPYGNDASTTLKVIGEAEKSARLIGYSDIVIRLKDQAGLNVKSPLCAEFIQ